METDAIHRVLSSAIFFQVSSNLHLQLWVDCRYSANWRTGQAEDGFSQVCRRADNCTAFVNQSLYPFIKVKATLATWTTCQVHLHHRDFFVTEFPVDI